jgi:hypothetical protein
MNNKSITESVAAPQKRYLLEDTFVELNRLYEADEQQTAGATVEQNAGASSADTTTNNNTKPVEPTSDNAKAGEVVDKLKDSEYETFVKILNSDGKSKAFLNYLRQHYKFGDDSIGTVKAAKPQLGVISCSKLQPTQKNISLSKSLGMITKPGWSEKIINNPIAAFDTPTVTYASKYIIDGHHRWSKAYALNGDCKIKVLNFPAIDGVSWEDMLKAVQLAIVTMVPSAKLVNEVSDDNMLADDGSAATAFYVKNACDEVVTAMQAKGRGDDKEAQGSFVGKNVAQMKETSKPVNGAKARAFMPQMDDDGKAKDKIIASGIIDMSAE